MTFRSLSSLPESSLLFEVDRRNQVDELIVSVERQHGLGIGPAGTQAREIIGRLNSGANHHVSQLHSEACLGVDLRDLGKLEELMVAISVWRNSIS